MPAAAVLRSINYSITDADTQKEIGGFAQLAVYDGDKAAKELERCVKKLGFHGVLFNGYSQVDRDDNLVYLDEDRCAPIWAAMQELDVPLYLHPRTSYQQLMYKGHQELICANWGYACETGTHAVRILVGGVFDRGASDIRNPAGAQAPTAPWGSCRGAAPRPMPSDD